MKASGSIDNTMDCDNPEEADYEATRSDWNAVGQDIHTGISLFEQEQKK
jgi:hypothetical protein